MNKNEFKAAYIRKGYTQKTLADELGMTQVSLWKRMTGKVEVTLSEMNRISSILELTPKERNRIFQLK